MEYSFHIPDYSASHNDLGQYSCLQQALLREGWHQLRAPVLLKKCSQIDSKT